MQLHILLVQCPDSQGLIARITSCIAQNKLNIIIMREFVEPESLVFFARFELEGDINDEPALVEAIKKVLPEQAYVVLNPKQRKDVVVLATKEYHCLADLLIRHHFGTLQASIKLVIANHPDLGELCKRFEVPFTYISHENKSKADYEAELIHAIAPMHPDYIILAKFMRILSPSFVAQFKQRIINIHHSFLPAFVGANPYKQAHERGVKLIGATAHFVTDDLDEGPIIAQQIIPVNHTYSVADMKEAGHEVEKNVLYQAVSLVLEDRVFVVNNKTIVFD